MNIPPKQIFDQLKKILSISNTAEVHMLLNLYLVTIGARKATLLESADLGKNQKKRYPESKKTSGSICKELWIIHIRTKI